MSDESPHLLARAERLMDRIEAVLPQPCCSPTGVNPSPFATVGAGQGQGVWSPCVHVGAIRLDDLQGDRHPEGKDPAQYEQFVDGKPANNVLLTGARGTGKSSLIKACLHEYAAQGLRLIEVDKTELVDLPDIVDSWCPAARKVHRLLRRPQFRRR
jgi:predicted AAA+ superfamily ATPase